MSLEYCGQANGLPLWLLYFFIDAKESRLFGNVPDDIYGLLSTKNVTENFHHYGLKTEVYFYKI